MVFSIVHRLVGRMRVRASKSFVPAVEQAITVRLAAVDGLKSCTINARTGSVLVLYAEGSFSAVCLALQATAHEDHVLEPIVVRSAPAPCADRPDIGPLLRYIFVRPFLPRVWRVASAVMASLPFLIKGLKSLLQGRINVDVLDMAAIGISLLRLDFRTVGLLVLLLGFGETLETWTRKKSLDSLAERLALDVDKVWVERGGVELETPLQDLEADDMVIVRTGATIPVDGVVVSGEAVVNQASMTGEPLGVMRGAGGAVFAGTVIEEGELRIRVTGSGNDTRLQRIVRFIEESEALKANVQGKAERLADAVVPFSFLLAGLVWLITRNPARAAAVLLVDYSCALHLATPLAVLAGMREGAGHGVLVKGGRFLEALAEADTVVFDKTGTLTAARPEVREVIPAEGWTRKEILRIAACLEEHFPHPVARAVVHKAEEEKLKHQEEHTEVEYVVAHGIASRLHGRRVLLGSRHYIHHDERVALADMAADIKRLTGLGRSILYIAIDGKLAGLVGIEDPLRPETPAVLEALRARGVNRIIMLTGDDERTAAAVARQLGIGEYRSQVLPTDKSSVITQLRAQGRKVIMVGDGINDSPALSAADVGVCLRDGADLAREVADVVLTTCDLRTLVVARDLGRGTLRRIHANFGWIMGLNSLFLAGGLFGVLMPGLSAMLHNLSTLGVAVNAMRPVLTESEDQAAVELCEDFERSSSYTM